MPHETGVLVTNEDIYRILLEVKGVVIDERGERRSLTTQVRLLWTLFGLMLAGLVTVAGTGLVRH